MPSAIPPKLRLSKRAIDALACPPDRDRVYVFDLTTPALAVCRTRAGAASFYLYRRVNGRPTRIRLGGWPELTVEQARKMAAKMNMAIQNGENPQVRKQAAREELTCGELFDQYFENHAKPHKRTWTADRRIWNTYLKGPLRGKRLSMVTSMQVAALHARIGRDRGHHMANRCMEVLRSMYSRAIEWGLAKENPAARVKMFPEPQRERFIQPDEMPRFLAALRADANTAARDCFLMALLTGARRGNVMRMRWDQISMQRATWTIPATETKNGKACTIPLVPPAVEILEQRAINGQRTGYVFPGRRAGDHMREPKHAWSRIVKRAGIENLHIHDLRRSLGSWMAGLGVSTAIIGKQLGHSDPAATAIYARLNLDPVRLAVNTAVQAMLEAQPAEGGAQ